MSVSIVIPHYNFWEYTHALMSDLYKHERGNISEIVLVDNGGTDEGIHGGQKFWKEQFEEFCPVHVIALRENVGFLLAANLGLQEAAGIIKVLISNDVRIKGEFVKYLNDGFLATPLGKCLIGQKLYVTSTGWNEFDGKIFPYLEGFFLAAFDVTWETLDYFDTRFVPSDYEDVDLSTAAIDNNFRLLPLNLPYIEHQGAGTYGYNPEREAITRINREKFRQKWVNKE